MLFKKENNFSDNKTVEINARQKTLKKNISKYNRHCLATNTGILKVSKIIKKSAYSKHR